MAKRKAREIESIYFVRVSLLGSDPEIWRRFMLPGSITLGRLHDVIQAGMGWENCHLHQFETKGGAYADLMHWGEEFPEFLDEHEVRLAELIKRTGGKFLYIYDIGDDWVHECRVDNIVKDVGKAPDISCIGGENACPPEDCGGIGGYYHMLNTLKNPGDPNYKMYEGWLDKNFDPTYFDLKKVSRILKKIKV